MIMFANVALLLFASAVPFLLLRPIAGLGSGIGFGYGLRTCGASARPTRSFGILTACMSLIMIIGFQAFARLIQTSGLDLSSVRTVANIVFGIYAALAGVAAIVLMTNKPAAPDSVEQFRTQSRKHRLPITVVLGLIAIAIAFVDQGAVWPFLQTLGMSHGFAVKGVANTMSIYAAMGIVGSVGAAACR